MNKPQHGASNWIGQRLVREEDEQFLTGAGCFTDDIQVSNAAHAYFVRSPHAHAQIKSIDTNSCRAVPGVLAVLTADDLQSVLSGPIPSMNDVAPFDIRNRDGAVVPDGSQPVLAHQIVRYVGESVAVVVAHSAAIAREASELVDVEYEPRHPTMSYDAAVAADAKPVWESLKSNRTLDWTNGREHECQELFDAAAHVVECRLTNNRIAPCFMEPRAAIARYDASGEQYRLDAGCQGVHGLQAGLAALLGIEPASLRVVAPDTGGGFGARGSLYPEYAPLLVAARQLGQPVRWTSDRSEGFLTDLQARDHTLHGELALDSDGNFLALRVRVDWRHGAYFGARNVWVITSFLPPTVGGVYRIPTAAIAIRGAFTNTTPQAAFRGIGRVEANFLLERLIDRAAVQLGHDRISLRRQNMLDSEDLPFQAAGGARYTTGAFRENLDRALLMADHEGFESRRARSSRDGRCRGFGVSMFIENDGGAPSEFSQVTAHSNGRVTVHVGTQDFGMGHRTVFKQVAAQYLDLPFDDIDVVYGDTDTVKKGSGSHGSRSARIGGTAVVMGSEQLIEHARALASDHLEAAVEDIQYQAGDFTIAGTDRSITLFALAHHLEQSGEQLTAESEFTTEGDAHSNGCIICEVEVDPETGTVSIVQHTMVVDVGVAINPLIVEGQMHGGAAQGLGQAGFESVVYDDASGQTLSGSFMDYAIPKADDLPMFNVALNEVAEPDNPLGVKGAGESATTGSPAALVNAVVDALTPLGVSEVHMPLTPMRVWQAIRDANR